MYMYVLIYVYIYIYIPNSLQLSRCFDSWIAITGHAVAHNSCTGERTRTSQSSSNATVPYRRHSLFLLSSFTSGTLDRTDDSGETQL